ncbi:TIGR02391 family protein [Amycolatopsis sp. WAC 04182]|uniref:TIGR02391 family protein n=1 Tax=Amycolatopsis sp. WAC 04182 TaxID=2203198 RepID=UPI000F76B91F|nr:TIGR02391 family protein [Amycolatopsis sp. WAC 04182]RSN60687.1 TIGR02391 family protein [Amycolatopsis sp. WAC 04182]
MEARKSPEYLRSVADAVEQFRAALADFLELHVINEGVGGVALGYAPAVLPRGDADPKEIEKRREKVTRLAGRASAAIPLTGGSISVQGAGVIDPIQNWVTITRPKPLLESVDVLSACDYALGRIEDLILRAEAARPPTVGAEAMHPAVWGPISRLWGDGHFREAVAAAAESVVGMVKARTGRNDVSATSLWQQAFSKDAPKPGQPRLRWPGDPASQDVKTMNSGLLSLAPGVQMTIRNSAAHDLDGLDEQTALERLCTLSLLARWVDECELVTV